MHILSVRKGIRRGSAGESSGATSSRATGMASPCGDEDGVGVAGVVRRRSGVYEGLFDLGKTTREQQRTSDNDFELVK